MILALSIDGLTAAFAYASNHVKMSWLNMAVIALIETLSLSCSMGAAGIVQDDLSIVFTKGISFVIFFCIGCSTLFQASLKKWIHAQKEWILHCRNVSIVLHIYADELTADQDHSNDLSWKETLYLALALSLDSAITGFAAGMQKEMSIVIVLLSFLIGMAMLGIGLSLGNYLYGKSRLDISWISGVVFLFLAFLKLTT